MFQKFVAILSFCLLTTFAAHSKEAYPGQYAQVDPKIQEFFKGYSYPSPDPNSSASYNCCDVSDCHVLTADLWDVRGGEYWFLAQKIGTDKKVVEERWVKVEPPERVITKYGNPTKGAIACYQWYGADPSFYCFTPGDLF